MSIRQQMIVVFGLVALLPLLVIGFVIQRLDNDRAYFDRNARLVSQARRIGTEFDNFFQRRLETARQNGLLPSLVQFATLPAASRAGLQTETIRVLLASVVDDPINVSSCALLDRDGVNVSDIAPERRGRREAGEPWFVEPLRTGLPYAAVYAPAGEAPAIWVGAPLRDSHGEIRGVLRLRYELAALKQILVNAPEISGSPAVGAIFDRAGAAIAYSEGFRTGAPPGIRASELTSNGAEEGYISFWSVWSAAAASAGERDRIGAVALRQMPLWVAIAEPESVFLAQINDLRQTRLFFGTLVSLLVISAVMVMARRLSKPIVELAGIARRGAGGDLTAVATEDMPGEVGALARDLNQMTRRLHGTLSELEHKVAEVRLTEGRARELVEASPVAAFVYDSSGRILQVNRKFTELLGYDTSQLRTIDDWWSRAYPDPAYRLQVQQMRQIRIQEGGDANPVMRPLEAIVTCRDGTLRPIEFHRTALGDRVLVVGIDLTERTKTEQALRASEERYRLLLEHSPEAVVVLDVEQGRFVDCNSAAEDLFQHSRPEMLRLGPVDLSPPTQPDGRASDEAALGFITAALAGEHPVFEWTHRNRSGRDIVCELRLLLLPDAGGRRLVRGSIVEITARVEATAARQRLEQQLWHAQKLEAVGTLAGGIAHDFNNILVGVIGNLQLTISDIPASDPARETLDDALRASLRARDLVARLLAIARRQPLDLRPTLLEPVVREAIKLVRASVPSTLAIETTFEPRLPAVRCDSTQIHQIVVNLATNAAHAMQPHGGTLAIGLQSAIVDAALQSLHPQLRPGNFVCLSVRDTGCGMDAATLAQIFDPFFTTKHVGEGSGLGLAVVHGIVQSLSGAIVVESTPGVGTTFRVYFPETTAAPAPEPAALTVFPAARGARIALVDDESIVRQVLHRSLVLLGCKPVEFPAARDLLAALHEDPDRFDAVITDYTMPETNGVELAQLIHALRPDLPIILASGNTRTLDWKAAQAAGVQALLEKPFTFETLSNVLGRVLEASRGPAAG